MNFVSNTILILLLLTETHSLPKPNNDLNVYALPVGQGDATVIQCPKGKGGLTIIDIGSSKYNNFMSASDINEWLCGDTKGSATYAKRIERIFLSHPDKDHYNFVGALECPNLPGTPSNIEGVRVFHTCKSEAYKHVSLNILNWINGKTVRMGRVDPRTPKSMTICSGFATITVLASELSGCYQNSRLGKRTNYNEDSLVLRLQFDGKSILFPGDISGNALKALLSVNSIKADVLRLPHHGALSDNLDLFDFFVKVRPHIMFSSSGFVKNFKHPHCGILDTYHVTPNGLSDRRAQHWYTCYDGAGVLHTGFTSWSIYTTATCECDQPAACNAVYQKAIILNFALIPGGPIAVNNILYDATSDVSRDVNNPCNKVVLFQ